MAVQDILTLKTYFETGDVPTQAQYIDLLDTIFARTTFLGPFANDADAAAGGVLIDFAYKLTATNDYGIPSPDETTLKVRKV